MTSAKAITRRLVDIIQAVDVDEFNNIICAEVNGVNWFDARDSAIEDLVGAESIAQEEAERPAETERVSRDMAFDAGNCGSGRYAGLAGSVRIPCVADSAKTNSAPLAPKPRRIDR